MANTYHSTMNRNRKYITSEWNERRKQEHYVFLYSDARKIEKGFPTVEGIEIAYINSHKSIVNKTEPTKKVISFTPQSLDIFVIDCLNPECSSFGYDLKKEIRTMIHNHKTEQKGELHCEGQDAPDHPEQSCEGSLKYTIRIVYK